jgi:Kdo2-lipid IVA lauroyltransferase/acyltransferase
MSDRAVKTRKWFDRTALIGVTRVTKLFSRIVPYRLGVWSGGVFGTLGYYLLSRERNRAIAHLTAVFGEKSGPWIRCTARRCFAHLGKSALEVMLMTPRRLAKLVDIEGEENLRAALSHGNGVIFVTGHIGNWEVMAAAVAARQYSVSVIAAPIVPEQVNDTIINLRAGLKVRTIVRGRPGAARELIRVFKENRLLGILIDQDTDVEGAFVDFMGTPAWTPTAAASMAIKFNAPVIFGYTRRGKHNRHTVKMEGPIGLVRTDNAEQDIITNTALLTKKIEACIRDNPEQWVWMHRRWRKQP